MRRYAIVGASNPIGAELVRQLHAIPTVERVLAVGTTPVSMQSSKAVFVQREGNADLADLFLEHWIDGAIFLTWSPSTLSSLEKTAVAEAFQQFLTGCHRAGVLDIVVTSSAMVSCPDWERPAPKPESGVLDGLRTGLKLVDTLLAVEKMAESFTSEHPEVRCAIARPCTVLDDEGLSLLGTLLKKSVVLLPSPMAPVQLCHPEDFARALATLLLSRASGAYNIAPGDVLGPDDVSQVLGQKAIFLRASVLGHLIKGGQKRWGLDLGSWPAESLRYVSDPWLADGTKFSNGCDFKFEYSSLNTLAAFMQNIQGGGSDTKRRYKLLRALTRR